MSRQIKINKYEGNTHYSVSVIDKYGQEHHIGYYKHIYTNKLEEKAQEVWSNEVKPEKDLLSEAIAQCIEIDKSVGITPSLD
jgi:predicted metallo-beta-lactamase superfamily hydrolase